MLAKDCNNGSDFNKKCLHVKELAPEFLKLLQKKPDIIKSEEYFFFDEFQDIDQDEYNILKFLHSQNVKLGLIGDDAQNIYSFRSSLIDII